MKIAGMASPKASPGNSLSLRFLDNQITEGRVRNRDAAIALTALSPLFLQLALSATVRVVYSSSVPGKARNPSDIFAHRLSSTSLR